jgi:hypothetical protein
VPKWQFYPNSKFWREMPFCAVVGKSAQKYIYFRHFHFFLQILFQGYKIH